MKKRKKSNLETRLTILLGRMHHDCATKEDLQVIVDAIYLVRKYLPFYKEEP